MRSARLWVLAVIWLAACYRVTDGPDPLATWAAQTLASASAANCGPSQVDSLYVVCYATDGKRTHWVQYMKDGHPREVGRWWFSMDPQRAELIFDSLHAMLRQAYGSDAPCAETPQLRRAYQWARGHRFARLEGTPNWIALTTGDGPAHCWSWRGVGPPWSDPEQFIGRPEPAVRRVELDSLRRAAP